MPNLKVLKSLRVSADKQYMLARISVLIFLSLGLLFGCDRNIGNITTSRVAQKTYFSKLKPVFSVNDVTEGDGLSVTFSLPVPVDSTKTFLWAISGAGAATDFPVTGGSISLGAGDNSGVIVIPTTENFIYDSHRSYELSIRVDETGAISGVDGFQVIDDEAFPIINFASATQNVNETNTGATSIVSMTPASKFATTVSYTVSGSASSSGVDHNLSSGSLTIPAGSTSAAIPLTIVDDVIGEGAETIDLTLTGVSTANANLGAPAASVITIVDNESVNLTIDDLTVTEGASAIFTVSISSISTFDVSFDWATQDGTGDSTNDYTAGSGTSVTIPAGSLSTTITVATRDDLTVCEAARSFSVNLTNILNAALVDGIGTGTVTDPDRPTLSFDSATSSAAEGTASDTVVNVVASLSEACPLYAVGFDVTSAGATATSAVDFTSIPTTGFTIPAGATSVNVPVTILKDALFESDETLTLSISNPTQASTVAPLLHTLTISNDDAKPTISIADRTVAEGSSGGSQSVTFTVTQSAPSGLSTQVNYATSNATATQPADYASASGTVTIAAGATSATFTVSIVQDTMDEDDESLNVTLSGGNGNYEAVGSDLDAVLTITDDDAPPVLTLSPALDVTEGATLSFSASLSAASGKTITADYASADGTATGGADYTVTSGTLTFPPGTTSLILSVPTTDDSELCELTETLTVSLSNFINVTSGVVSRSGNILENDSPILSLDSSQLIEGASASVTMTADFACPTRAITANYATFGETALEGQDYTHAEGVFTIAAAATVSNSITINTIDDSTPEIDEKVFVGFSGANVGVIGAGSVITIQDNDAGTGAARLTVGPSHSCAISTSGELKCWGQISSGVLEKKINIGDVPGETETVITPVPIPGPYSKVSLSEFYSCVLLQSGGVRCWGSDSNGTLGYGNAQSRLGKTTIAALTDVNLGVGRTGQDLCSGSNFNCIILDDQSVKCWGYSPGNGSASIVGYNAGDIATAPVINLGADTAASISCGHSHACVVTNSGRVRCWGSNNAGQLGVDTNSTSYASVIADLGSGLTALSVSAGDQYTCAVLRDAVPQDRVKCWGSGTYGRTGQGTTQNLGDGRDQFGFPAVEMGDSLPYLNFGIVPDATEVLAANDVACAGFADGSYRCWGLANYHGSGATTLGDNPGELQSPVLNSLDFGPNTVIEELRAKYRGFCGIIRDTVTSERTIRCFGSNSNAGLGAGVTTPMRNLASMATPVILDPAFTVSNLADGFGSNSHQCALGTKGIDPEIRCWGRNDSNQTGGGNFVYGDEPTDMGAALPLLDPGLDGGLPVNLVDVKSGGAHTCILTDQGKVKCLGRNYRGQLGIGNTSDWGGGLRGDGSPETFANQAFVNLPQPAVAIAAKGDVSCAITDLFDLYCWGYHGGYSNTTASITTPILVDLGKNLKALGVSIAGGNVCAHLNTQQVKCWGSHSNYLTGIPGVSSGTIGRNPGEIAALAPLDFGSILGVPYRVKSVHSSGGGNSQICAVFHDNTAKCWGYNGYGALGTQGAVFTGTLPTYPLVALPETLLSFLPGYWTNCAVTTDFRLKCWGGIFEGESAIGSKPTYQNDLSLVPFTNFGDNAGTPLKLWTWAGEGTSSHHCAVIEPGDLKCWGRNENGVLGLGDITTRGDDPGETGDLLPVVDLGF